MSTNSKRFWQFFLSRTQKGNPSFLRPLDTVRLLLASLLKRLLTLIFYFFSTFKDATNGEISQVETFCNANLSSVYFTVQMCTRYWPAWTQSKPPGLTTYLPASSNNVRCSLAPFLNCVFFLKTNVYILHIMSTPTVSSQWKCANAVPIFKERGRDAVENYRPVSLLGTVSKVMERYVCFVKPQLFALQHGFIKGKSSLTQLLDVYHQVVLHLDKAEHVNIVFLDLFIKPLTVFPTPCLSIGCELF